MHGVPVVELHQCVDGPSQRAVSPLHGVRLGWVMDDQDSGPGLDTHAVCRRDGPATFGEVSWRLSSRTSFC